MFSGDIGRENCPEIWKHVIISVLFGILGCIKNKHWPGTDYHKDVKVLFELPETPPTFNPQP